MVDVYHKATPNKLVPLGENSQGSSDRELGVT